MKGVTSLLAEPQDTERRFSGLSRLYGNASADRIRQSHMVVIGIGAFFLKRRGYEMAPFVLGLVLGELLDKSLRRGLVLSDGSLEPFFTRPICAMLAAVTVITMLMYVPAINQRLTRWWRVSMGWLSFSKKSSA